MYGLKENIIKQIRNVFENFPQVEEVLIYGSRAKGNNKRSSDIDLTLKGDYIDNKILNEISLKLDELYLPQIFDISNFRKVDNKDLIDHINRVGKVFYKKRKEKVFGSHH